MLTRCSLLLLCLAAWPLRAATRAPIAYTLSFPDAAAHYVDVTAAIPAAGADSLTVFMPVWTPGSYLVREYAGHIVELSATGDDGSPLAAEKTIKNRWRIDTAGTANVTVHYRLYGRTINVRGNWVEADFAVINGAPTFITVVDDFQRPYTVTVHRPEGWQSVQTSLLPDQGRADTFTSPDFDTLVDSPIVAGSPQVDSFEVDGIRHTLVTVSGGGVWDNPRVARNLHRVVEAQRDFWGELPYDQPYYFFNLLTGNRGGLEHRQSLSLSADRWLSRTHGGITSWLSLASHEFFHAWNGKRLRPVELGPFDYEHENYSPSLWVVEGLTSYYQHVLLTRAGFYTPDRYLGAVSGSLKGVQNTPGRHVQALSESSFDAWIKAYRTDENSTNALFSYYGGGAVAGFLIDAEIQRVSDGAHSLDDVMRAAFERYSAERGYTQDEFIALASEIAGHDLTAWFHALVQTPGEWDYQPALDWWGLEFETPKPPAPPEPGTPAAADDTDLAKGWLGIDIANQDGRIVLTKVRRDTPAAAAGLSVDDEIIAVDGHRMSAGDVIRRLELLGAGTTVELLVSRRDQIISVPATLALKPEETWRLNFRADATAEQKARVEAWLGQAP
ncbi:M61 family metallopeptidase [Synoicihabitans lomoniglobus]|uniref:PDZ domain-containing protein n=1 Tax=Synoicihabitans lomoniglobus TaxID=2909285 RepID=A0AAF0CND5_9BACT|nr:PDZ domain-containing protein [Opitutaceae bacterium LMO-M01]WED65373.1 PDZ domain-containing protein [Opitutaceae bacterium LMO-M01]